MITVTVTVMDGHGHGDGRLKRSGTIWNEPERNETKRSVTVTGRFPLKTKDSLYKKCNKIATVATVKKSHKPLLQTN